MPAVGLRSRDWHRGAAVTALAPALSCRSAGRTLCLSKSSVAEEYYAERSRYRWVSARAATRAAESRQPLSGIPGGFAPNSVVAIAAAQRYHAFSLAWTNPR